MVADFRAMSADFGVLWGISSVRTLCYSCVRVGAAALGTVPCAAYTALYSVWMPLSFVAMPLRSAAMVFLPPFLTRPTPGTTPSHSLLSDSLQSLHRRVLGHASVPHLPFPPPRYQQRANRTAAVGDAECGGTTFHC
jgi:hypothetical protein